MMFPPRVTRISLDPNRIHVAFPMQVFSGAGVDAQSFEVCHALDADVAWNFGVALLKAAREHGYPGADIGPVQDLESFLEEVSGEVFTRFIDGTAQEKSPPSAGTTDMGGDRAAEQDQSSRTPGSVQGDGP